MRTLLCFLLVVTCASVCRGQNSRRSECAVTVADDDRYSTGNIKSALEMAEHGSFFSVTDIAVENDGDAMTVAVLKLVPAADVATPTFVRAYLHLARTAFSNPDLTLCVQDRQPEVTLLLLNYLHDKVDDEELRFQIKSAEQFIEDQTKNAANSEDAVLSAAHYSMVWAGVGEFEGQYTIERWYRAEDGEIVQLRLVRFESADDAEKAHQVLNNSALNIIKQDRTPDKSDSVASNRSVLVLPPRGMWTAILITSGSDFREVISASAKDAFAFETLTSSEPN